MIVFIKNSQTQESKSHVQMSGRNSKQLTEKANNSKKQ